MLRFETSSTRAEVEPAHPLTVAPRPSSKQGVNTLAAADFDSARFGAPVLVIVFFVFAKQNGSPLKQEWLYDFVWKPTLRHAGIAEREQYCIRDTFISLALSSGEDPGWVAQVCGTSEEMIFRHYRKWIPGLQVGAGTRIGALLHQAIELQKAGELSPRPSPARMRESKLELDQLVSMAERGDLKTPTK
jgi:hypothetical protein